MFVISCMWLAGLVMELGWLPLVKGGLGTLTLPTYHPKLSSKADIVTVTYFSVGKCITGMLLSLIYQSGCRRGAVMYKISQIRMYKGV